MSQRKWIVKQKLYQMELTGKGDFMQEYCTVGETIVVGERNWTQLHWDKRRESFQHWAEPLERHWKWLGVGRRLILVIRLSDLLIGAYWSWCPTASQWRGDWGPVFLEDYTLKRGPQRPWESYPWVVKLARGWEMIYISKAQRKKNTIEKF